MLKLECIFQKFKNELVILTDHPILLVTFRLKVIKDFRKYNVCTQIRIFFRGLSLMKYFQAEYMICIKMIPLIYTVH